MDLLKIKDYAMLEFQVRKKSKYGKYEVIQDSSG